MSDPGAADEALVVKDESNELPVPSIWRPVFCSIIKAFVERDYALSSGIPGVAPISLETAEQIEEYIADYGETLTELSEETWDTSISLWMGERWDVLVDLWTAGEGRSDMVLSAHVSESGAGFEYQVYMVYVPQRARRLTRACSRTGQQLGATTFGSVWHQSYELWRIGQPVALPLKLNPLCGLSCTDYATSS